MIKSKTKASDLQPIDVNHVIEGIREIYQNMNLKKLQEKAKVSDKVTVPKIGVVKPSKESSDLEEKIESSLPEFPITIGPLPEHAQAAVNYLKSLGFKVKLTFKS